MLLKRICGRGTTNDVNARYPAVVEALAKLPDYGSASAPVVYYVFDVMVLAGRNVMREPLQKRRELLMSKGEKMHRRLLPGCRLSVSALSKPLRT
jgi:ATP-dependent DNA ligase